MIRITDHRLTLFTLFITLGTIFAGCQAKRLDPLDPGTGEDPRANTYVTVSLNIGSLSVPDARTRAAEDPRHNAHPTDPNWAGRDRINELIVYLFDADNATEAGAVKAFGGAGGEAMPQLIDGKMTLTPWKTTPGKKVVYAIANPTDQVKADLAAAAATGLTAFQTAYVKEYDFLDDETFTAFNAFWESDANKAFRENFDALRPSNEEMYDRFKSYRQRYGMVKPTIAYSHMVTDTEYYDVIMMTGAPASLLVLPNVTSDQAKVGHNNARIYLRRVVAQAVVTLNGERYFNDFNGTYLSQKEGFVTLLGSEAKLHHLSWAVQQYERKSYLSPVGPGTAEGARSPSYDYSTATLGQDLARYYYYPTGKAQASDVHAWYDVPSYYMDHDLGEMPFTKSSSPSSLTTTSLWTGDPKNDPHFYSAPVFITETTHPYTADAYRKGNTAYFVVQGILEPAPADWADGEAAGYQPNGSSALYYGIVDGKYYSSYKKAYEANNPGKTLANEPTSAVKEAGDNIITYPEGRCYYIAYVNPDVADPTKWTTSPVVRNNIYHMNISGFSRPGYSGIPLIPGNTPLTPDPDEPIPSPSEVLKDTETYMTAAVTVQGWGIHAFEMTF